MEYIYYVGDIREYSSENCLGWISQKVKYQVLKGGQNITCQAYNAISQSTTNHVYNMAVPSLETVISRKVLWKSIVSIKISVSGRQRG